MKSLTVGIVLAGLIGPAAVVVAAQAVDPAAIVRAQNAALVAAVAKKDAQAIAALYTAQAESTQGESERTQGREGIQQMFQNLLDHGLAAFDLKSGEIALKNGAITESGQYAMKTATGQVLSQGTYVNTWVKDGAVWKIQRNVVTPAK